MLNSQYVFGYQQILCRQYCLIILYLWYNKKHYTSHVQHTHSHPVKMNIYNDKGKYSQTSNISHTLGNKIVDHSDVVGASPVGAAPTTFSFST